MVYGYLLDLYQVLEKRKKEIQHQISKLSNDPEKLQYQNGRLSVISDFKIFLESHYQAKLPRRIRRLHKS